MQRFLTLFSVIFIGLAATFPLVIYAQTETPQPVPTETPAAIPSDSTGGGTGSPITATVSAPAIPKFHVIAEGESLFYIAELYGTTVELLQLLNNITDPALVYIGQELLIPGAEGEAVPTIYSVRIGDTLADIATRYRTTVTVVAADNHLVRGDMLVAGQPLAIISRTGTGTPDEITGRPYVIRDGDSLSAVALRFNMPPALIAAENRLTYPYRLYRGQRLRIPAADPYRELPDEWIAIEMGPLPAIPGDALAVYVEHLQPGQANGSLQDPSGNETMLRFAADADRPGQVAIVGLDAFAEPGRYLLKLGGEGLVRPWFPWSQAFTILPANYGLQNIVVNESLAPLLAPNIRSSEDQFLDTIFVSSTAGQMWTDTFQLPVSGTIVTAGYGDARSYNGGPIEVFHSGIDFGGQIGTPILAPAAGHVVFSDTLTLRGNTLVVDHGLGIMTAYYHLARIDVAVGDRVVMGQPMAAGGNTGLSTGPHLHWDVRVWGKAVDPARWITRSWP